MFYSPVIISQSFSKLVPLDCVVQKCFHSPTSLGSSMEWIMGLALFPFPPLQSKILELDISFPPGQLCFFVVVVAVTILFFWGATVYSKQNFPGQGSNLCRLHWKCGV